MKLITFTALMSLSLACSTSAPTPPSEAAGSIGSSADALRKLGQLDAQDVDQCRAFAASCVTAAADSGSALGCDQINEHCDALEAQLADDRSDVEQCLERAVACEAAATDPTECEDERAACASADGKFRGRREGTLQCSNQAEQCLGRGMRGGNRGFGRVGGAANRAEPGDAGPSACDDDAVDFVGCCQHRHDSNGDAGARGEGDRFGRGRGLGAREFGEHHTDRHDEQVDAGPPRNRFSTRP